MGYLRLTGDIAKAHPLESLRTASLQRRSVDG